MKKRTYNNVLKATKMISKKGYSWETANEIAIACFDNYENAKASGYNPPSVDFYVNLIADCN